LNEGIYSVAVGTFKRGLIAKAMTLHKGNVCRAAKALGMHRNSLWTAMRSLGMKPSEFRGGKSVQRMDESARIIERESPVRELCEALERCKAELEYVQACREGCKSATCATSEGVAAIVQAEAALRKARE
jgi:hypothetical protein